MVAINPMRIPWLFVCPNASSLLGSQSFHLCNHCRRLNLVSVLLEHWRELRRKWIHFILESLCFTETNRVLLLLKLQLHHLVRIRKAPVSCQFVSPLTVSRVCLPTHIPRESLLLSFLNWIILLVNHNHSVLLIRGSRLQSLNIRINGFFLLWHRGNGKS